MKRIGFPINNKENEKRRAITLEDIYKVKNRQYLYFEKGYLKEFGVSDEDIEASGANIASREDVLNMDVICDPKAGDGNYLDSLKEGQIIFGWIHGVNNRETADKIIRTKAIAIAWEDMYEKGRHIFWRNNEIAGEAAVYDAFSIYGKMPYDVKAAVIGRGNTGRGAYRILLGLGAEVRVYNRNMEELLRENIGDYDVIVNCVMWNRERHDHLIRREDLRRMKRDSLIIDVSCDEGGAIETSVPTTIEKPTYYVDGVMHYVVDHTPSIFFKTASRAISREVARYVDDIIEEKGNSTLEKAVCIDRGKILDERIIYYQDRY